MLTLSFSFTSCTKNEEKVVVDKSLKKRGKDYSAEETFRAIFFLQGELVDQVPSLYNLKVNSEILRENVIYVASKDTSLSAEEIEGFYNILDSLSDSIVEEIKLLNPDIFYELKYSIENKEPEAVTEKLKECSLLVHSALYRVYEFKEGLSILELAEKRANINPSDYNFKQVSEIERFNKDLQNFIDGEPDLYNYHSDNIPLGVVVILMVVVVIYLAVAILAVLVIFGEIFIFYFNFVFMHNFVFDSFSPFDDGLQGGEIVRDLILIKG